MTRRTTGILLDGGPRRRGRFLPRLFSILVIAMLVGLGGVVYTGLNSGGAPAVKIETDLPAVGQKTTLKITVTEPERGLTHVRATISQGGGEREVVDERLTAPPPWHPTAQGTLEQTFEVEVGKNKYPKLRSGPLVVKVEAVGIGTFIKSAPQTTETKTLEVRLAPPTVDVISSDTYAVQGGAEAVVYRVGATSVKDGVRAGKRFFPGHPLPNGMARERVAVFAAPYDLTTDERIELVATDDVGNERVLEFVDGFTAKPFKTDTINVTDRFMKTVVPKILAATEGFQERSSLVETYVAINSELRRENDGRLRKLASQSAPKFLFDKKFIRMPAKTVSSFADRRTYEYEGRKIDRQDHLGFDLASVKKAPVPAANDGTVVLAQYLGIYGNAVVIDHGLGLMSLYGHLSSTVVQVGQSVTRGQTIGRTGATGLALGDHLHFTVMLNGLPVNATEWWDGKWIKNRIATKLTGSWEFKEG